MVGLRSKNLFKATEQLNLLIKVIENKKLHEVGRSLYFHQGIDRCWRYWENPSREIIVV